MGEWTDGYVAGIDYLYEYQPELNPIRLPLAFLNAGLAAPTVGEACELGFGQGVTTNLHAAASTTRWFGTDFNSAQTGFAQELAIASGAGAKFFDQSFAEFCRRDDLPDFDFVAMHGVWSWISEENRRIITDFLRRKLKVGGVLYVGYNTQAGNAAFLPIQDVLSRHAEAVGASGGDFQRQIGPALDFADKLLAVSPLFAQGNPEVTERLKSIRAENKSYVAHEYFNRNWYPTPFLRMAELLGTAKLEYACSGNYFNTVDAWNLTAEQQALLGEIPDASLREAVRDVMVNQTFRKDYWVKGARRLSLSERVEGLRNQRVVLMRPPDEIPRKVRGALGERMLFDSICGPVLEVLADYRPRTLGQVELAVRERGVALSQLIDVVMTFMKSGGLSPVQDDASTRAARPHTDRLNAFLCDKARHRGEVTYLASPVIVSAVNVGRVAQFFLYAMNHAMTQPAELASFAWQVLQSQSIAVLRDGKPLESREEQLQALKQQAAVFIEKQLPVLKALQVA